MGFFSRLSNRIEKVNKGEDSIKSLSEEMLQSEASYQRQDIAQNIIINAVKATNFFIRTCVHFD